MTVNPLSASTKASRDPWGWLAFDISLVSAAIERPVALVKGADEGDDLAHDVGILYVDGLHGVVLGLEADLVILAIEGLYRGGIVQEGNNDVTVHGVMLLVHVKSFSLPNILLGEPFETELLQDEVQPARIAAEVEKLCRGSAERPAVLAKLRAACECLGQPGAAERVAAKVLAAAGYTTESNEEKA